MEIRSVKLERAAYRPEDFPRDGRPQFAIAGRSNVGKSSLINTILRRRDVARVSQTPGKTQAIHFYLVNERFYIVDLPGYGYAKVSRAVSTSWGELVRSYLETSSTLRTIFLLLDSRREPGEHDLQMKVWSEATATRWVPVLTKVDKLSNNELVKQLRRIAAELEIEPEEFIRFSKVTRQGVDQFWREIATGWDPAQ
ncbi:MAG: ribosome biogenesis GTP-binding protein YihA/YsxC [Thermoanaerobaculia bacterium]